MMGIHQVLVHHVTKSAPGYHVSVVPSWAGELHHYRNFVSQAKNKKVKDEHKKLPHMEDTELVNRFVEKLIQRVELTCYKLERVNCRFIDLG